MRVSKLASAVSTRPRTTCTVLPRESHILATIAVSAAHLRTWTIAATRTMRWNISMQCPLPFNQTISRSLATTAFLAKKNKDNSKTPQTASKNAEDAEEEDTGGHPKPDPSEPNEFPDVLSRFSRAGDRFAETARKIRSGPTLLAIEEIGSLPVQPERGSTSTFPLRELANVVPRQGRIISLLVHEAAYVKPIMSAVQQSPNFNQQPQRSPDNELELTMKIPRESAEERTRRLKHAAMQYREAVRLTRQRREKQHERWVKEKVWVKDIRFKANKDLQKMVEKRNAEIDKLEAQVLKSIASMREE